MPTSKGIPSAAKPERPSSKKGKITAAVIVLVFVGSVFAVRTYGRRCSDVDSYTLSDISLGFYGNTDAGNVSPLRLAGGKAVELPAGSAYSELVGARVMYRDESYGVGTWALQGNGGVIAINDVAQTYTQWGTAARSGSPMDRERRSIEDSDEHKRVLGCVDK
jgi:hypothetical protein